MEMEEKFELLFEKIYNADTKSIETKKMIDEYLEYDPENITILQHKFHFFLFNEKYDEAAKVLEYCAEIYVKQKEPLERSFIHRWLIGILSRDKNNKEATRILTKYKLPNKDY